MFQVAILMTPALVHAAQRSARSAAPAERRRRGAGSASGAHGARTTGRTGAARPRCRQRVAVPMLCGRGRPSSRGVPASSCARSHRLRAAKPAVRAAQVRRQPGARRPLVASGVMMPACRRRIQHPARSRSRSRFWAGHLEHPVPNARSTTELVATGMRTPDERISSVRSFLASVSGSSLRMGAPRRRRRTNVRGRLVATRDPLGDESLALRALTALTHQPSTDQYSLPPRLLCNSPLSSRAPLAARATQGGSTRGGVVPAW